MAFAWCAGPNSHKEIWPGADDCAGLFLGPSEGCGQEFGLCVSRRKALGFPVYLYALYRLPQTIEIEVFGDATIDVGLMTGYLNNVFTLEIPWSHGIQDGYRSGLFHGPLDG